MQTDEDRLFLAFLHSLDREDPVKNQAAIAYARASRIVSEFNDIRNRAKENVNDNRNSSAK